MARSTPLRILFISAILPHARVVSGFTIIHQRIRLLAERGHQIGILTFASPDDEAHIKDMRAIASEVVLVPRPSRRELAARLVRDNLMLMPPAFWPHRSARMALEAAHMVAGQRYHVVVAEHTEMAQYFHHNARLPAVRRVISCHQCLSVAYAHAIELQAWSPKSVLKTMASAGLHHIESRLYRSADHILALTVEDRQAIHSLAPEMEVSVIPYGVNTNAFTFASRQPEKRLIFTGYFKDEPNVNAALWFARTVWPVLSQRHADLSFNLVGRDPTAEMLALQRHDPRIKVTGEVPDLLPYLHDAMVFVCPIRMGSGFRGKILQAMAAGVPVVSTELGARGVPAQQAHNIMLADTAPGMVVAIDLLLGEPDLRATIRTNARKLVEDRYAWSACVDRLEEILENVVRGR